MEYWIPITLFAALMQIVRTGWQKSLTTQLNDYTIAWLRFVFALPLTIPYLLLLQSFGLSLPTPDGTFLLYAAAAGVTQIIATVMLVQLFSRRNFAVCTAFAKTEAAQIALFGLLIFDAPLSMVGVVGVALGTAGILLMIPRNGDWQTSCIGVSIGGFFALTAWFIKEAVLHLEGANLLAAAALTLTAMLFIQTILLGAFLLLSKKLSLKNIWQVRWRALGIGVFGFLGTVGWASAFALTHPAFVKTLAQIELPLAYILGRTAFAEKPSKSEIGGMIACAAAAIVVAVA
ncbi:MAG: hypothetical protein ACNYPH_08240 [Gammaproteobacteria bacterium WSBS_2016_MAG_OTU1]